MAFINNSSVSVASFWRMLGMLDDTPIAFWYREERASRIYDGPDEVRKIAVAKRILERYGLERRR